MKVFLAGTTTLKKHLDVIKKSNYFLESYFSIKEWQLDYLLHAKDFILDSGAFTFMGSKKDINFKKYAREYGKFVSAYNIENFIELDIESVVGWEEYLKINDILQENAGKKAIPVFHKERGKEWFLRACKDYSYIAYGGIAVDRKTMKKREFEVIPWFIKKAHENDCAIHGLGFTSTSMFDSIRFDTIDSTTWTMGGRMGNLCYFENGKMKQWYPSKNGMKPKNIEEITVYNYLQWCKFQRYAEEYL